MARTTSAAKQPKLLGKQRSIIYRLLDAHCHSETIDDKIYANYEEDWSDTRVAREAQDINPIPERPIATSAVARMRAEAYGLVRDYRPPRERSADPNHELLLVAIEAVAKRHDADLEKLNARVAHLEEHVTHLTEQLANIDAFVRLRGYRPPPGRPQSSPPMENGGG
jgi:hypothetical protein